MHKDIKKLICDLDKNISLIRKNEKLTLNEELSIQTYQSIIELLEDILNQE